MIAIIGYGRAINCGPDYNAFRNWIRYFRGARVFLTGINNN